MNLLNCLNFKFLNILKLLIFSKFWNITYELSKLLNYWILWNYLFVYILNCLFDIEFITDLPIYYYSYVFMCSTENYFCINISETSLTLTITYYIYVCANKYNDPRAFLLKPWSQINRIPSGNYIVHVLKKFIYKVIY